MTTAYQWIIDNSVDMQVNKRAIVAQTMSRDQTIRTTSRGGQLWRFEITPSPGARWSESRGYLEAIDKADRYTKADINFSAAAFKYIFGYLGSSTTQTGWTASVTNGSDTITVAGGNAASGFRFKAGDVLQIAGDTRVYAVSADVAWNSTTVVLNRQVTRATGTALALTLGQNVVWKVICTQLPDYKLVSVDRVEWSGSFGFVEALV